MPHSVLSEFVPEARGLCPRLDAGLAEVAEAVWKNKWRLARMRQQMARGYKEVSLNYIISVLEVAGLLRQVLPPTLDISHLKLFFIIYKDRADLERCNT